jgi:signal transduction histidine kinase
VTLQAIRQAVRISFQDNGAGIPTDIHHKIFVPNFSTKFTGSGIGLAIVKKGIESSGGRIWFETQEGMGTTFYIELPLAHP